MAGPMNLRIAVLSLLIAPTWCTADYEVLKADDNNAAAPAVRTQAILPDAGGPPNAFGHANGYEAVFANAAPHFRVLGPLGGTPCHKRVKTSVTAKAAGCQWATNAAPFNMSNGDCDDGFAISNGVTFGTGGWKVQIGVTADGSWVVGTLNESVVASLNLTNSVNGFGWLVRGGAVVVGQDTYRAPRTTVGVTKDGRLLSLEVDGCEPGSGCLFPLGNTTHEMATLLAARGAYHAINLDGGGSSAVVADGKVIDHPTDMDRWILRKERAVTSIVCVL